MDRRLTANIPDDFVPLTTTEIEDSALFDQLFADVPVARHPGVRNSPSVKPALKNYQKNM